MPIKYWALQSKVKISNGICTLMRLWLRRQRGCIFFESSNVAEYHLPTYLRFIIAFIRSVLEYCCPVWHHTLPVKLSDSIERVQKQALRIIFPALHYQEALATTGCVPLHTRRMELCSKLFTKIKEPASCLCHLVPPTPSQVHGHSLCNKDRPSFISCKTEHFKRSFFPAMCLYAHGM